MPSESLRATIEDEVIPRLVLSHLESAPVDAAASCREEFLQQAVARMADCAEAMDLDGARAIADEAIQHGLCLEQVLLQLLAGAARLVGRRWERDQSDFVGITLAIGCLQTLLHQLAEDYRHEREGLASERRILVSPVPGEQHAFGAALCAEIFRCRGWTVDSEASPDGQTLARRVSDEWFHVVALSISCDVHLPLLAEAIRTVRSASRNRRVGIMVGGHIINQHPEWLGRMGADACCNDVLRAVEQAGQLVGLLVHCR